MYCDLKFAQIIKSHKNDLFADLHFNADSFEVGKFCKEEKISVFELFLRKFLKWSFVYKIF